MFGVSVFYHVIERKLITMKKKLLLFTSLLTAITFGQNVNSTILDYNQSSATISDGGTFFQNSDNGTAGYEFPKNSNRFDYFGMQIWMGGRTAIDTFLVLGGQPGLGKDEQNGPILSNGNYSTPEYQNRWSQGIWEISQAEIDLFNEWWLCMNGVFSEDCVDNVETPSIELYNKLENWPATGNVSLGEPYWLLPFWDRNSDGFYDINDGDYPIIKGCKSVFLIKNDDLPTKTYSGTESMEIQTLYEFYQINTEFNEEINQATFLNVSTTNFSDLVYEDFSIGVHLDPTNISERYLGFDPVEGITYYYANENNNNALSPDFPVIGIFPIENSFTSMLNRSLSQNNSLNHFNTLKGMINSTDSLFDSNGNSTNFLYYGDPIILGYSDLAIDTTYDRRSVSSTTFDSFSPMETISQTFVFISDQDPVYFDGITGLSKLQEMAFSIKSQFENNNFVCYNPSAAIKKIEFENIVLFYPNPAENTLFIESKSVPKEIQISDISGKVVKIKLGKSKSLEIDISELKSGVYFIKMNNSKKMKFVKL